MNELIKAAYIILINGARVEANVIYAPLRGICDYRTKLEPVLEFCKGFRRHSSIYKMRVNGSSIVVWVRGRYFYFRKQVIYG